LARITYSLALANAIIRDQASELGAEVVGEEYLILGSPQAEPIVEKIKASKPDLILNTINGDSNIAFFRVLRAAGISPEDIPTVSFSISEEELANLKRKVVIGDYAAWNYFESIDSPTNRSFVDRFRSRFGAERVVSDPMEAAYFGVHIWAQAVTAAKSDDVSAIRLAVRGQKFIAPEGPIQIDPETQHTSKFIRIGQIKETGGFKVVFCSDVPIDPIPYPKSRTKSDWIAFLTDLQLRWGGWANPGR